MHVHDGQWRRGGEGGGGRVKIVCTRKEKEEEEEAAALKRKGERCSGGLRCNLMNYYNFIKITSLLGRARLTGFTRLCFAFHHWLSWQDEVDPTLWGQI